MNPKVNELVNFYDREKENIKKNWNETETRIELINPLFECLGWDVNNNQKLPDNFKDVKHEASLKIGSNMKAPDYSFHYGSDPLFYLEAKKPSVNINTDINPAYQLRRYGWTKKLPISILTNFEDIAIYDCRIKPNHNDSVGIARIKFYTYKDYIDKWDELNNFISKEAIIHGSLNDFKNKQVKGTASIDDDFLDSIEKWRKLLALNIASKNPELNEYELNFAIQMIIDRIIFLRICEDRGIENYELLKDSVSNNNCYEQLINIFQKADDKYNSGLFHFKKERTETPDNITLNLKIDDKILKEIITGLYYPDCPYELSVISSDVLGSVYERFLGKVIRLTDGHHAKVEEKPEVRKAGGVYYTPDYIVKYIVKNTVGEIIKDKTPNQVSNIKILDPACGSGSFLIEAYDCLLKWYLTYYLNNDPEKWSKGKEPKIFNSNIGFKSQRENNTELKLTLSERKRILLNNIFGVDIDKNAVEVTKLSLLLKVLEYEGMEVQQKLLFNERILPDLYNNIKCGNSLIGTDIYELFKDSDLEKINPFDWNNEFKEIMNAGGFDCIIGNPPYFNIQTLGVGSTEVNYIMKKYIDIWQDKSDILFYFIYKAISISKGYIGFIISNAFLFADKAQKLRNFIIKNSNISKIVNFEKIMIFKDASITTSILILNNMKKNIIANALNIKEDVLSPDQLSYFICDEKNYFQIKFKENNVFALIDENTDKLNEKIDKNYSKLMDLFIIGKGMETAADEIFSFNDYPKQFPKEFIKKRVSGKNIDRYFIDDNTDYLLYFEDIENFDMLPLSIKNHLLQNKNILKNRADKLRRPSANWWNYTFAMHKEYYHLSKIFCSRRSLNNTFSYDDGFNYLCFSNMTVIFENK